MARPKKEQQTETEAPTISVIDRRLQNPFGTPSREIPLKGDKRTGWVVRTFATDPEHPNRHYDAVHRLGWTPLTLKDLSVSPESIGYAVATDGRIVRGPKGSEVLMAMREVDFNRVQMAKAAANSRSIQKDVNRDAVSQAVAKEHGPEAGDMVARTFSQQEIVEPI